MSINGPSVGLTQVKERRACLADRSPGQVFGKGASEDDSRASG
jgi:hypothetical protein